MFNCRKRFRGWTYTVYMHQLSSIKIILNFIPIYELKSRHIFNMVFKSNPSALGSSVLRKKIRFKIRGLDLDNPYSHNVSFENRCANFNFCMAIRK